ncbi:MAG TPA: BTAD domain-containing putative transcriptional regulator [Gemmatimonadaceae bacterium]|nr:BTAD domain-containing putative transcriptional regulator [Gemmatimonadaceae bacterium]
MSSFRTFGGVVLADDSGRPLTGAATQRRRLALLAVLASAGERGVSRDKLVALLWPESDADKARHALAQWLFLLRRDLKEEGVVVGTAELRIDPAKMRCDVVDFDRALARGDEAGAEEALALYTGPFLDGFYLTDAPPAFERWVDEERTRLARRAHAAATSLATAADVAGDRALAVRRWEWLVHHDPLSSRATLGYMRALAAAGDRAKAVQHARLHAQLVRQELESEPDGRVLALAEELRGSVQAAAPTPPSRVSPPGVVVPVERPASAVAAAAVVDTPPPTVDVPAPVATAVNADAALPPPARSALTPRRVRRRRRRAAELALVAALTASVVGLSAFRLVPAGMRATVETLLERGPATLDTRRVVVAPLENRANDTTLAAFGDMAADWITQAIAQMPDLEVVDARTSFMTSRIVDRIPRLLRARDPVVALARETGAGTAVGGRFYRDHDSLRVHLQLTDVTTGRVVRSLGPISGPAAEPARLVESVSRRASALMAASVDTSAAGLGVRTAPAPSYEAYREISRAWEDYFAGDLPAFFAHAERAVKSDSTYALALVMKAYVHTEVRQWAQADSLVRRIDAGHGRLAPVELAGLDMVRATLHGDLAGQLHAAEDVRRSAPSSPETSTHVAHLAVVVNRPRTALAALSRLDPNRGMLLVAPFYFTWGTAALHEAGEYDRELALARRGVRQFPTRLSTLLNECRALAAKGDVAALRTRVAEARFERVDADFARRRLTLETARELAAHGHPAGAREFYRATVAAYATPRDTSLAALQTRAAVLAEAEHGDEARFLFRALQERVPTQLAVRGSLGLLAARLGERGEAERIASQLAADARPFLMGRNTIWRARIAVALGDREQAVALLRQAFAEGYPIFQGYSSPQSYGEFFDPLEVSVHADPALLPLHGYPPFERFLEPRG